MAFGSWEKERKMIRKLTMASLLALTMPFAMPAMAQRTESVAAAGTTRLDVAATGEVTRVPDIVRINAGVVTRAATAGEALRLNAAKMDSVRAALRRAGIAERDIQTSNVGLQADYRYADNQPPQLTGYQASNQINVRFRDIAASGQILDALVAAGANQINGPSLEIEHPESALDEARLQALANARARAELYARALGKRVTRILFVSETGAVPPSPMPVMEMRASRDSGTQIVPGEQTLSVSLTVGFALE
jgi:uncharacterized protein YggE